MPPPSPSVANFPAYLEHLFRPKRYKVLYGGRGAGRSWGVARALLLMGTQRPIRVLCVRELQNSIEESVHKLLSDQVGELGLGHFYEIQKAKVLGANGTSFSFDGIKNNTNKIKSYEGIDFCWVEEANKVSKYSWDILIPTIRGELSEIWITFNPELDEDHTYSRFVKNADLRRETKVGGDGSVLAWEESANSIVVKGNYRDNPWFPQVLRDEMEECRKRDPDSFMNIWEGHTRQNLDGAVYAKELRRAQLEGRVCDVPWAREAPVDTVWDLGRGDSTAIWFVQRVAMQYRMLGYFAESGEDIGFFLKELQSRSYVYGRHFLPHDAKAKRLGTKKSIQEIVQTKYPGCVTVLPKWSIVDGINAARMVFGSCWFDEDGCADGLHALRRYCYKVVDGQLSNTPLHNWASDGADAFRYFAIAYKSEVLEPRKGPPNDPLARLRSPKIIRPLSWLGV
jgi:phage terminase large subunit